MIKGKVKGDIQGLNTSFITTIASKEMRFIYEGDI
jgi:hypothetical protein